MSGVRRGAQALLLAAVLATTGCVTLPDAGEVRDQPGDLLPTEEGIRYLPASPAPGASPESIVTGFLDAMLASPVQTSSAREFLTRDAATDWAPQQRVLVYDDVTASSRTPGSLRLNGAAWVDEAGHWRGALPAAERRVDLSLEREDGEWRIGGLPDALLARRTWFSREYGQFQVHFFDASRSILVPEPVFVPRGGQLATSLVRALLAGPPERSAGALMTRLRGLRLADGAVTVSSGTARVDLAGPVRLPTTEARTELAAQLAWTLRQVPDVRTLQVRIDDTPLTLEGGLTEIPVHHGVVYDPAVATADDDLYGLMDGHPARVSSGIGVPIAGPWAAAYRLRELSVDLTATTIAGVRADGREVRIAPLEATGDPTHVRGEDFAHPAWDRAGRLWLLDRRSGGAGVTVIADGRLHVVAVPGISGRRVTDLLVSRDGTRLVAAVDEPGRDAVVVSRLRWDGDQPHASSARRIARITRLRDLAWHGPTEVLALGADGRFARAHWLSLDGAPEDLRSAPPADTVFEDVRVVVSSAADETPAWALTDDGDLIPIGRTRAQRTVRGVAHLTWVG